ncbi:serine hydrolase domain-containing protein [Streptomyces sp. NPDC047981]|uniref:serine hydrolase domain-containing protein n=1 Tax=Streptomyces sp. NPDC047981 TaxID=3154610 RepID=UPI00343BE33F
MNVSRRAQLSVVAATLVALSATALPARAAVTAERVSPTATVSGSPTVAADPAVPAGVTGHRLDRVALRGSLDAFHKAGMYGAYSAVRDGSAQWRGATGFADIDTRRPTRPDFEHRVGSITKTFTAVAVLQQAGAGRIDLDAPVGRYIPDIVSDERGRLVTVRMLLNHTSGIADYVLPAFPGLLENPGKTLDDNRLRTIAPDELARLGLAAAPVVQRGTHSYANTNYILAGLILERVTGQKAEAYITRNVIRKAGLRHTYFPSSPAIKGPHARMYESFLGMIDPARDYSVYDMSWAGTAGALVSTTSDLNDFYRKLLGGRLLGAAQLREMKTTVPAYETAPGEEALMRYGLGIYTLRMPSGGWYWGHDGAVFGAGTWALSTEDGRRQVAIGYNLMKYQRFDSEGRPLPDPITEALYAHVDGALAGTTTTPPRAATPRGTPGERRAQTLPALPIGPDALHQASLR